MWHHPAQADAAFGESRSIQVKLADLNLGSTEGRQSTQRRVHAAASSLCSYLSDTWEPARRAKYDACVASATASASGQLQTLFSQRSATQ